MQKTRFSSKDEPWQNAPLGSSSAAQSLFDHISPWMCPWTPLNAALGLREDLSPASLYRGWVDRGIRDDPAMNPTREPHDQPWKTISRVFQLARRKLGRGGILH
ncbi:hypothetical protein ABZX51_003064 [Aspergillus tubingensis]